MNERTLVQVLTTTSKGLILSNKVITVVYTISGQHTLTQPKPCITQTTFEVHITQYNDIVYLIHIIIGVTM